MSDKRQSSRGASERPAPDAETEGPARIRLILVTGLSGAGKTSALKALEDLGYEAVDNLPLTLLPGLMHLSAPAAGEVSRDQAGQPIRGIAVGIDCRTRDFAAAALEAQIDRLHARPELDVSLVFLDCDDAVLGRRFSETRRRHPLALDRPVSDGIAREREIMGGLKRRSDLSLDSSQLTLSGMRQILSGHFRLEDAPQITVTVISFSYRLGLPRESDLVFDVRFLENPHYVDALRPHTGRDPAVGEFIASDPAFPPFLRALSSLVLSLLPGYAREGKSYLTMAVGCTGGRHRSVFVAEKLALLLEDEGYHVTLVHRDIMTGQV